MMIIDSTVDGFAVVGRRLRRLLPSYRIHRQNSISFEIGGDENAKEKQ